MYTVRREYSFSAAHRIKGHPKCGRLHGHNYHVWVSLAHDELNTDGMVMDFSLLDDFVKPILDEMDHRYLRGWNEELEWPNPLDIYQLVSPRSTAECIASEICLHLRDEIQWPLLIKVEVGETKRSIASYVSSK